MFVFVNSSDIIFFGQKKLLTLSHSEACVKHLQIQNQAKLIKKKFNFGQPKQNKIIFFLFVTETKTKSTNTRAKSAF
jgi:hypothetical protein